MAQFDSVPSAPGPAVDAAAADRGVPGVADAPRPDDGMDRGAGVRVRFGITVGKRNARRAVERALVKRVLREAARQAAAGLDALAGARTVDVVLRLKSPCPAKDAVTRPQFRRALRTEADALLAQLASALRGHPSARPTGVAV